ncbi:uncharacterized protein LOC113685292 isoform X3 [Pocillopora damicornis]|uniref:uncharacterized protein LOC113685292 isoform X3 n=1 Tax=Pocillopora damicornis TaxID=46731 RepID=UPI000F556511|nr:uncharacterized protein LOC113685292 isoform X3 [Pocillopora damicornis]
MTSKTRPKRLITIHFSFGFQVHELLGIKQIMCLSLKDQFRRRNLWPCDADIADFSSSMWLTGRAFIVYRVVLALYATAMTVLAVIERQYQGLKWLIFLTNWSYTFINLHFVTQAFLVYYYQTVQPNSYGSDSNGSNSNGSNSNGSNINGMNIKGSNKEYEEESESDDNSDDEQFIFSVEPQLPLACKVSWIICDIASNIAFPVTVMFWSLVYKPGDFDFVTLNSHALNSVLIVIDIMLLLFGLYELRLKLNRSWNRLI